MNKYIRVLFLILGILFISACGGGGSRHEEEVVVEIVAVIDEDPVLKQFDVIDSYGISSKYNIGVALSISPYVDSGFFEIFWNVLSYNDYTIYLSVSNKPSTKGSRLISSQTCNPYTYCHDNQYQLCEYSSDFYISCEDSEGNVESQYIGDILVTVPQQLYFILEMCDAYTSYCEYQALPIYME